MNKPCTHRAPRSLRRRYCYTRRILDCLLGRQVRTDARARNYLREVAAIRPVAVKETSYYPALSNLFNEIGHGLKPRVRCIIHPSSNGAGLPDGGFFTPDQLRGTSDADLITKVPPSRGVIEAKGTGENADTIARTPQVAKYLERYGQVLVTTLRDFVLVGRDADGQAAILERYALAPNEAAFWQAALHAA